MLFPLVFAFPHTVQVLDLNQLRLDNIEFEVKFLCLLSGHCQSAIQFEKSLFQCSDTIVCTLQDIYLYMYFIDVLKSEQAGLQGFYFALFTLLYDAKPRKLSYCLLKFGGLGVIHLDRALPLARSQG